MLLLLGLRCTQILLLSHLELLWRPDVAALRSVLVEVGVLRCELEVVVSAILLSDLERIKCIALELSLAIQVHILERHRTGKSHCARATVSKFLHPRQLCLLPFVLRSLHLLMLLEHRYLIVRVVGIS